MIHLPSALRRYARHLRVAALVALSLALASAAQSVSGQTAGNADDFEKQSVALRTALHYDPSLGQPLKTLLQLYEKADRGEELLGLYRAHVAEYPDDAGAQVVLIRLLQMLNRADVGEMIQSGVREHPEEPMLHYLLYESYHKADDQRALATLSKAIELQTNADRADIWLDELLELSRTRGESEEATKHLIAIRDNAGNDASALLAAAQRMHRYRLDEIAVETLTLAEKNVNDAETGVEIQILLAKAEAALGEKASASKRVVAVIDQLAADHWRRSELNNLRLQLAGSDAERKALLDEAKARHESAKGPAQESAALDYAGLLSVAGQRRKAASILIAASAAIPASGRLEKAVLDVLDRLGDEKQMLGFLQTRVELQPERSDLRFRLVKSQYLAGDYDLAAASLDVVLDTLANDEKIERLLDVARYLRNANLDKPSIVLLDRVVKAWPERLDVRRELAETLVSLDRRPEAAELLRGSDFAGAEIENFLDLMQFMLAGKFHIEARDALESRLALEADPFEIQLLLVDVLGRIGERQPGEKQLAAARALADTPARYRRWLDAGFKFHEIFEDAAMFFDREQYDFVEKEGDAATDWDVDRIERFLGLIEAGAEGKLDTRVTQALRNQLAQPELPTELSLRLRLLLVKALEQSPENAVEVEKQLTELAAADNANAGEYDLRRALLYHAAQRPDLAQELIGDLALNGIDDKSTLRASYVMFLDYSMIDSAVECVERLAVLDAADLVNAQRQLSLYAALGREDDLRRSLRRLLAGIDKVDFSSETLAVLRSHLLDSYWRSISRHLDDDSAESIADMSELLDAVERESLSGDDRLWVLWARAYLLNRTGQGEGRNAVLGELEDALADSDATEPQIVFPDGLATTMTAARAMLSEAPVEPPAKIEADPAAAGPLRPLAMTWAFECESGAMLTQIEPIASTGRVLALDDRGSVYCIDAANGKLIWRERFIFPESGGDAAAAALSATAPGGMALSRSIENSAISEIQIAAHILTDGSERFFLPIGNGIRCHSVEDGKLLWETDLDLGVAAVPWSATHDLRLARPPLELSMESGRLLAFAPAIGVAASLEAESGKLIWLRTLAAPGTDAIVTAPGQPVHGDMNPVFSLNSGAAFGDGSMMVFGNRAEILDTTNGSTLWSLGVGAPRQFPVQLRKRAEEEAKDIAAEPAADKADLSPTSQALSGAIHAGLRAASINHRADESARHAVAVPFIQYSGTLLAPAAHWAQGRLGNAVPHDAQIVDGKLLLMGTDTHQISLSLPVGSDDFTVDSWSSWIGATTVSGWTLHDNILRRVDFERGSVDAVLLDEIAGEEGVSSVILSSGRLYAIGDAGVLVLNAFSGGVITKLEWPDALQVYRHSLPGEWQEQVAKRRVWQGGVFGGSGRPLTCIGDGRRATVLNQRLYVTMSPGSFVALDEAKAAVISKDEEGEN